ncbi:hypothetical protein BJ165DRAFT_1528272 [Panaeolus papilionaceus]|nr:hypothetical protein BJ165DRAFT_1528272 [Panaeolus papilionaceus]
MTSRVDTDTDSRAGRCSIVKNLLLSNFHIAKRANRSGIRLADASLYLEITLLLDGESMANSGSGSEHSAITAEFGGTQSELLSSKYQRKAKLLKSITKVSSPADQEVGGSTLLSPSNGTSNQSTPQPHEEEKVTKTSSDDTKTPDQTSGPDYMRDESRPQASNTDSSAQSSEPQHPPPAPISPGTDMATTCTTPRQLSPALESKTQSSPPQAETNHEEVDASHLVPHLSAADLDRAKNLVLDLLGWGVQPEYLLSAGLSHELVFRVFADLNLRMPTNLKITDTLMDVAYSLGRDDMGTAAVIQIP